MSICQDSTKMTYQQIHSVLLDRIRSKDLVGKLPSIGKLSRQFDVSHNTINKVLDQLKQQKLVYGLQGKGVFVNEQRLDNSLTGKQVAFYLHFEAECNQFYFKAFTELKRLFEDDDCFIHFVNSLKQLESLPAVDVLVLTQIDDMEERDRLAEIFGPEKILIFNRLSQNFHWVGTDNLSGGYLAIEHLYSKGHRKIGVIPLEREPVDNIFGQRYQGLLRFAYRHPDVELCCLESDPDRNNSNLPEYGEYCMGKLLEAYPGISAVFAFTDILALGAYNYCQKNSLSIPNDISLMGFDDSDFAACTLPPLTTVREDTAGVAKLLKDAICSVISEESFPLELSLAPTIVERQSIADIRPLAG